MFEEDKIDMNRIVGSHDVVLLTLDTLRLDAALLAFSSGQLPGLKRFIAGFEARHSPASFTYASHQAFLAGFLPTPMHPIAAGKAHPRLFALAFAGSESTTEKTYVFQDAANLPAGFASVGYRTICIGGVGFFNLQNPLGRVLPGMFEEAYWRPEFSVTVHDSTDAQVALACELLADTAKRVFMLLNVSAIHQPNRFYLASEQDTLDSHQAALVYVDQALQPLWEALARRGPAFVILCSDHGTAYGEDGYFGHRNAHPSVMHVPYAHFVMARS